MLESSVLLLTSWLAAAADGSAGPTREVWAGHQIVFGSRDVPFEGTVATRTDTFTLARVRRRDDSVELTQIACRVLVEPVAGVEVKIDAAALPRSAMRFAKDDAGEFVADAQLGWGEDDVDGDGNPGVTVRVQAPVCSGELYVSNQSRTRAQAAYDRDRFEGRAAVRVVQHIIDAKGACLSVVARDTDERVRGPFAFVRVAADATCEQLLRDGWPVDAESN
ncbi:MAG TPA: hypothetical protein VG755_27370 [Nannocystaceae bacterium]|nr:hypothetical protein [Nannocystaceae bacterium]